jgi:hypothetical protein
MAAWLTFRSSLRSRWLTWVGLALLVGATAGGVLAGFAGARRMATAPERFRDEHHAIDVLVGVTCDPGGASAEGFARLSVSCLDGIRGLPSVGDSVIVEGFAAQIETEDGRSVQLDPTDPCYSGPARIELAGDRSGRLGVELNAMRIVAGRRADPAAADEVVISKPMADRLDLGPGSLLKVSSSECPEMPGVLTPRDLHVVGVGVAPGEVQPVSGDYLALVHVTPAFLMAESPRGAPQHTALLAVRLRDGADLEALRREIAGARGRVDGLIDLNDLGAVIDRGIRAQSVALAIGAGLVALAGAAVLGQLLVRQSRDDSADQTVLAALGMTVRGRFTAGLGPAVFMASLAGATAVLVAVAVSPLTPFDVAREIEPDRGLWIDATVVVVGGIATATFAMSIMTLVAWRQARRPPSSNGAVGDRSVSVTSGLARAGLRPTVVSGVRMALERGTVPVGTSVWAMALAVLGIAGSLTFGAGLTHLLTTPRVVGVNWDIVLGHPTRPAPDGEAQPIERTHVEAALAEHPGVTAFTAGTYWPPFPGVQLQLGPERRPVAMYSFDGNGEIGPSLIRGRVPTAVDEMLVGPETLDDLGLSLGDSVDVFGQAGTWEAPGEETSMRVRIVGVGVIPLVYGDARLGRGATLTLDGVRRLNPQAEPHVYWLRLADGSDPSTVVAEVLATVGATMSPDAFYGQSFFDTATSVREPDQIDRAPRLFAVVMGFLAIGVVVRVLASGMRAHRRDLAVGRALGFRRRDVGSAVGWQAITYALAALVIGVPLGVVVGRLAWRLYAERLGVVPESVTPWTQLALLAVATIVIAASIGVALGRRSSSGTPATALRAE